MKSFPVNFNYFMIGWDMDTWKGCCKFSSNLIKAVKIMKNIISLKYCSFLFTDHLATTTTSAPEPTQTAPTLQGTYSFLYFC